MVIESEKENNEEQPETKARVVDVGDEEDHVVSEGFSRGFSLTDEKPGSVITEILQRNRAGFYGGSY